jgi:hypothetical protein
MESALVVRMTSCFLINRAYLAHKEPTEKKENVMNVLLGCSTTVKPARNVLISAFSAKPIKPA